MSTRIPWLTLLLAASAALLSGWPGLAEQLQYERGPIRSGEWWRVASCHFVHCSPDHALWNLAATAVLSAAVELRGRRRWIGALVGATAAIPCALWLITPELSSYRGLSGLASALIVLLALQVAREGRVPRAIATSALLLFAAKVGFELSTGAALFVENVDAGFVPIPLAHAVGGSIGWLVERVGHLAQVRPPTPWGAGERTARSSLRGAP